jgi:protein arginine kinase activator
MKCERCAKQATYHITEVLHENHFEEVHLCEQCAKAYLDEPQKASDPDVPKSAPDTSEELDDAQDAPTCEKCGLSFLEFRNHGRFGCAHDYDAFHAELLPLLNSIHKDVRHVGKTPRRRPKAENLQRELTELREQLKQYISEENYEQAARVRDRIKELEAG